MKKNLTGKEFYYSSMFYFEQKNFSYINLYYDETGIYFSINEKGYEKINKIRINDKIEIE